MFVQAKIQGDKPLLEKYQACLDSQLRLEMFSASAFVSVKDVRSSFEALIGSPLVIRNHDLLLNFINHLGKTWEGRDIFPPTMKLEWWNMNAVAHNGMSRTSNAIEGPWHLGFA